MLIGVNYEGKYDKGPLEEIIKNILRREKIELEEDLSFKWIPSDGPIIGGTKAKLALFLFGEERPCDLVVFFSDINDDEKLTKLNIEVIKNCREKAFDSFIIGYAEPEIEQWFLEEEDALKGIFELDPLSPLSLPGDTPKGILENLCQNFGDYSTKDDLYRKIATKLDLGKLLIKNRSFKKFYNDFSSACKKSNRVEFPM